jgi:hypothetical protein
MGVGSCTPGAMLASGCALCSHCELMLLRYAFFARTVEEHVDGRYEFRDVSNGRHVGSVPAAIRVICVLVLEAEERDSGAGLDLSVHVLAPPATGAEGARIVTRFRQYPRRRGSMPRYEYLPIEVEFTAARAGAYRVQVDQGDQLWYTGFYRIELEGLHGRRPRA